MKLSGKVWFGRHKPEQSRRKVAAQRQAQLRGGDTPSPHSYQRNRMLNSRKTATPAETSERLVAHKLADQRRRLVHHLIWVVFACVIVLMIMWQSVLSATVITPQAIKADDSRRYIDTLELYYSKRPAERLRFLTNEEALRGHFLAHAPEVKSIRIEGDRLASAQIKLVFRQPVAQWSSAGATYFVDDDGVTFEKNYFTPPAVAVRDESGVPTVVGQEVINRQFLSFLGQAVASFKKEGMIVTEAILPADTVRQVMFQLEGRSYPIRMTIDRGAGAQVAQAVKAIRHLDSNGIVPQYLDVRVDQRAFYK